jgi:hypothetical protein
MNVRLELMIAIPVASAQIQPMVGSVSAPRDTTAMGALQEQVALTSMSARRVRTTVTSTHRARTPTLGLSVLVITDSSVTA